MDHATRVLEAAAWSAAHGHATDEQLSWLEADRAGWRRALEHLLDDTEDSLDDVRSLNGPERAQVVADFEEELARLEAAYDVLTGAADPVKAFAAADPAGEVRLQASWHAGQVVVWAGGPEVPPATNDELADLLEAIGGPALGWTLHPGVNLPGGVRAEALAIPVEESLGWLVAVGGGLGREDVGSSVAWLGRVAVAAVRLVARGAVVPTLHGAKRQDGNAMDLAVRWSPALVDAGVLDRLVNAMPGPVTALASADARSTVIQVMGAAVPGPRADRRRRGGWRRRPPP